MSSYPIQSSDHERARLSSQAELLRPYTERLLINAGAREGSSVLDLGTGAGDVALIAAKLVGPAGRVVGIDIDADHLAHARKRAEVTALTNVTFVQGDINRLSAGEPFDIAVGRYVLMYQSDPVATVREVATVVRPGGAVAFHELNMFDGAKGDIWPQPPGGGGDAQQTMGAGVLKNVQNHMGVRLPEVFSAAGLDISAWGFEGGAPIAPMSARKEGMERVLQTARNARRAAGQPHSDIDGFEQWWRNAPSYGAMMQPPAVMGWARKKSQ
jgi:SAM-dependent methyltransferase